MIQSEHKKRIAKNTIVLYMRMLFMTVIGLYTGRVVLEILGIDNYGIYATIGGLTGFMSFLYVALATGTSRFITFGLGKGDEKELNAIFSSALNVHILMALLVLIISEPIGLWMIYHKLNFPSEALSQVLIVFHCSIISVCLRILISPFNAAIISHEKMNAFAYMSIFDVLAKLGILYLLLLVREPQRLGTYAMLGVFVSIITTSIYVIYCVRHFQEVKWQPIIDWKLFKAIGAFSGWSLFSTTAWALNSQGILIILNMFFSPAVVAGRAVSLTVNDAANSFVNNFRTAVNPQIIKSHAAGAHEDSRSLLLSSTKFSFCMSLFIALPLILLAEPVLHLWLVEVPPYTVPFLQLVLIQSMIQIFDNSFYTALYAKGQLKQNALLSPLCLFICFPIVYFCFKLGSSPLALSWCMIITCATIAFVIKPILLVKVVGYNYSEIWKVIANCGLIVAVASPIPVVYRLLTPNNWPNYIITGFLCVSTIAATVWRFGLDNGMKTRIISTIKTKLAHA